MARPQDAEILTQFQWNMIYETEDVELDKERMFQSVKHLINAPSEGTLPKHGVYLVKLIKGEVIGSLRLSIESATRWWILSVYVKKEFRRQGHYSSLYKHAVKMGKENGVESIKLFVHFKNERAQKAYHSLGMVTIPDKMYLWYHGSGAYTPKENPNYTIEVVQDAQKAEQWSKDKKNALTNEPYSDTLWDFAYEIR